MKKRILSILSSAMLLLFVTGGVCACKKGNDGGSDSVGEQSSGTVVLGPIDYVEGDALLKTNLKWDISEKTEAFYIGSDAIAGVKTNGEEISSSTYTVRNKYLLMPDNWYAELGVGVHECEVTYKTKSLLFTVEVEDEKPLVYTMPEVADRYIPVDKAELPTAAFGVPAQEKKVTYTVSKNGTKVDAEQKGDKLVLSDPAEGEYQFNVKIERKGKTVADETYTLNLVSREYFDGIIDTTDGEMASGIWKVNSAFASVAYIGDYTDKNGVTKKAIRYDNEDLYWTVGRVLSISPVKLAELMRLGYTSIGFWYCVDPDSPGTDVMLYNSDSEQYKYVDAATEWSYAEVSMVSIGATVDLLTRNANNGAFAFGILTQRYDEATGLNLPRSVYISEVVAKNCSGDMSGVAGEYSSDAGTVVLGGGAATVNGKEYAARVNNNFVVLTDEQGERLCGCVSNGILILDGKVYDMGGSGLTVEAASEASTAFLSEFSDRGYEVKYYIIGEDGEREEAETYRFELDKEYTVYAEFSETDEVLGGVTRSVTVTAPPEPIDPAEMEGKNIAPHAVAQGWIHGRANVALSTSDGNLIAELKAGTGIVLLDTDFVLGCLERGWTMLTVQVKAESNVPLELCTEKPYPFVSLKEMPLSTEVRTYEYDIGSIDLQPDSMLYFMRYNGSGGEVVTFESITFSKPTVVVPEIPDVAEGENIAPIAEAKGLVTSGNNTSLETSDEKLIVHISGNGGIVINAELLLKAIEKGLTNLSVTCKTSNYLGLNLVRNRDWKVFGEVSVGTETVTAVFDLTKFDITSTDTVYFYFWVDGSETFTFESITFGKPTVVVPEIPDVTEGENLAPIAEAKGLVTGGKGGESMTLSTSADGKLLVGLGAEVTTLRINADLIKQCVGKGLTKLTVKVSANKDIVLPLCYDTPGWGELVQFSVTQEVQTFEFDFGSGELCELYYFYITDTADLTFEWISFGKPTTVDPDPEPGLPDVTEGENIAPIAESKGLVTGGNNTSLETSDEKLIVHISGNGGIVINSELLLKAIEKGLTNLSVTCRTSNSLGLNLVRNRDWKVFGEVSVGTETVTAVFDLTKFDITSTDTVYFYFWVYGSETFTFESITFSSPSDPWAGVDFTQNIVPIAQEKGWIYGGTDSDLTISTTEDKKLFVHLGNGTKLLKIDMEFMRQCFDRGLTKLTFQISASENIVLPLCTDPWVGSIDKFSVTTEVKTFEIDLTNVIEKYTSYFFYIDNKADLTFESITFSKPTTVDPDPEPGLPDVAEGENIAPIAESKGLVTGGNNTSLETSDEKLIVHISGNGGIVINAELLLKAIEKGLTNLSVTCKTSNYLGLNLVRNRDWKVFGEVSVGTETVTAVFDLTKFDITSTDTVYFYFWVDGSETFTFESITFTKPV